tara:strand:- start:4324 stop:4575 length:252 start_codon:yes stop_codon:yes gene_type:complete
MSFGDYGFRVLDNTHGNSSTPSGEFFGSIECTENSTITLTNDTSGGDSGLSSFSIKEGHIIYGNFTDVSISQGQVICYLRKPK